MESNSTVQLRSSHTLLRTIQDFVIPEIHYWKALQLDGFRSISERTVEEDQSHQSSQKSDATLSVKGSDDVKNLGFGGAFVE